MRERETEGQRQRVSVVFILQLIYREKLQKQTSKKPNATSLMKKIADFFQAKKEQATKQSPV